jgi:two-component system response regulator VicR
MNTLNVKPKVLLVDDEELMHMLYKKHLENGGYEMISAHDGDEAMALVVAAEPQVIVMDIIMPGTDGLSVMREIKQLDAGKSIPVIVVTANLHHYCTALNQSGQSGGTVFLSKPLSPSKLLAEINRVTAEPVLTS